MSKTITVNGAPAAELPAGDEQSEPSTLPSLASQRFAGGSKGVVRRRHGAEPYDGLLWRLQARQSADTGRAMTLGLIGCERRVGVTTVAANLAVRASELQLGPVLLVETNYAAPRFGRMWKLSAGPGLAQLLSGEASYGDCLRPGPGPDLAVLPAGAVPRGQTSLWEQGGVEALLAEACTDYRLVVFDLPAADDLREMLLVAKQLDQVLLVVRSESTRQRYAEKVADRLVEDGVPLSGAVLNRQRTYVPRWLRRWM
jgi:Mrp family chromosome partitioning ATPase